MLYGYFSVKDSLKQVHEVVTAYNLASDELFSPFNTLNWLNTVWGYQGTPEPESLNIIYPYRYSFGEVARIYHIQYMSLHEVYSIFHDYEVFYFCIGAPDCCIGSIILSCIRFLQLYFL